VAGCAEQPPAEVVVYTTVDPTIAQPLLDEFSQATGTIVRPTYATNSAKVVGLAQMLLDERQEPRCDLVWNDEILTTLRLEREGLLRSYKSPAAGRVGGSDRSSQNMWYGLAPTARVLIINTNQIAEARRPKTIQDLIDPQWYDRGGIAKPLSGTAATHAACLFETWGDEKAREFFRAAKRNARILSNNKQVARAVATGQLAFGLTDADDAAIEVEAGMPVAIVYPDQAEGEPGTLYVPSTLALVKDSPHPEPAEQLLDFLVVRAAASQPEAPSPDERRSMPANFAAAYDRWDAAIEFLQAEYAVGE
jgi:iron(III) transport system substrate-binding protein